MAVTADRAAIDDIEVAGRTILVRVDFNVPLDGEGSLTDDRRIRMAVPTIRSIVDRGGRAVLLSHLGRPAGTGVEAGLGLGVAADRLRALLEDVPVTFSPGVPGDTASAEAAAALPDGAVLVLDNLRFAAGEKTGDADFAASLALLGDAYCNDAFGTAHRSDASMLALPRAMGGRPCVAGRLLATELAYLQAAIDGAERPFVAVLGGAKVSDKFGAIRHLAARVDAIVVGGAMANTLLAARGTEVGSSRVETDVLEEAAAVLAEAEERGVQVILPVDQVCAERLAAGVTSQVVEGDIPAGLMGLDIGPRSAAIAAEAVRGARTVVWNGPMGVFEIEPFDAGTRAIARAMVDATEAGATTIVGGGDSAAAIEQFGLASAVSHVSTGGGASLAMLEGRPFPSVEALDPRSGAPARG